MSKKRNYPTEGGSRGCGSCYEQCCLGLSRTEDHVMLTSSWAWRRRACAWKLLERIWGEVYTELQVGWRINRGTGLHYRHQQICCKTGLFCSNRLESMHIWRWRTYSCIMIIWKTSKWWQYGIIGQWWRSYRICGQVRGLLGYNRGQNWVAIWGSLWSGRRVEEDLRVGVL